MIKRDETDIHLYSIEALLGKVTAGDLPRTADFRAVFEVPMQDMEYTVRPDLARRAYGGSIDAALELHEAVLPGWSVSMHLLAGDASLKVFKDGRADDYDDWISGSCLARNLLIADLKILRAEAGHSPLCENVPKEQE